jgi:hypothetical protein
MWFHFHRDGQNSCWLAKPNTTPPPLSGLETGYVRQHRQSYGPKEDIPPNHVHIRNDVYQKLSSLTRPDEAFDCNHLDSFLCDDFLMSRVTPGGLQGSM